MSREGIMLAYPFEEKRLRKWAPPYIVQPKLDGERCRAIHGYTITAGHWWTLISSQLNPFSSVPHIEQALKDQLSEEDIAELDGELYTHGLPFESISSIVSRTVNLSADYDKMEYHIFDIVNEVEDQYARLLRLRLLEHIIRPPLRLVTFEICYTLDEIMTAYDLFVGMGYEGIIVRHFVAPYQRRRVTSMMKFKPKKSDIYMIVDYKEEVSNEGLLKGRMGALQCKAPDSDQLFWVGTGMNNEMRNRLWAEREALSGRMLLVGYQHITTGKGVPRFPVFIQLADDLTLEGV